VPAWGDAGSSAAFDVKLVPVAQATNWLAARQNNSRVVKRRIFFLLDSFLPDIVEQQQGCETENLFFAG
jgi:hypothetical protein